MHVSSFCGLPSLTYSLQIFEASIASAAAAVQQTSCGGQVKGAQQQSSLPEGSSSQDDPQDSHHAAGEDARRPQGRPQSLRAVRVAGAALSPLSQRQQAQQQQWQQQQQQARRAHLERPALQPSPLHAPQHDHPWHSTMQQQHGPQQHRHWQQQDPHQQPWQQQGVAQFPLHQQAGVPAISSADGQPPQWSSHFQQQVGSHAPQQHPQPPAAHLEGASASEPEREQRQSLATAADLAAYEQAANMLRQLHFERLQRHSAHPTVAALGAAAPSGHQPWHRQQYGPA